MNYQWIKTAWGLPDMGEAVWAYIQRLSNGRTISQFEPGTIVKLWLAATNGHADYEGFWTHAGPKHPASIYPEEVSHWMPYTKEMPSKPTY